MEYTDILGQTIGVGDIVAYPVKHSTSAPLRFAEVTYLGAYSDRWGGIKNRPQLHVVTLEERRNTAIKLLSNCLKLGAVQAAYARLKYE